MSLEGVSLGFIRSWINWFGGATSSLGVLALLCPLALTLAFPDDVSVVPIHFAHRTDFTPIRSRQVMGFAVPPRDPMEISRHLCVYGSDTFAWSPASAYVLATRLRRTVVLIATVAVPLPSPAGRCQKELLLPPRQQGTVRAETPSSPKHRCSAG